MITPEQSIPTKSHSSLRGLRHIPNYTFPWLFSQVQYYITLNTANSEKLNRVFPTRKAPVAALEHLSWPNDYGAYSGCNGGWNGGAACQSDVHSDHFGGRGHVLRRVPRLAMGRARRRPTTTISMKYTTVVKNHFRVWNVLRLKGDIAMYPSGEKYYKILFFISTA